MNTPIKIDFISDVSCPWCAIGLKALDIAVERLHGQVQVDIRFQPFELNPHMPTEGQEINEHLNQKYGSTPQQLEQTRETIRLRGSAPGFEFGVVKRDRTYNTFDAHRLLHWAGLDGSKGQQKVFKMALFTAYFTLGQSPASHDVLCALAEQVGLDPLRARTILSGDTFATEVREREFSYTSQGINSVPATILNDQHLISGGQPPEMFAQALRKLVNLILDTCAMLPNRSSR